VSGVAYQVEDFRDILIEAVPLLKAHWEEIALDRDTVPLDPDIEGYERLAAQGALQITTARDADGTLIGYAAYFIGRNLHYRSLIVGESDIFWIAPGHRRGMVGVRLFREAERNLKAIGVNKIFNKMKLHKDLGPLFERLGFAAIETLWAKAV
jgi:GNAT superfamily N-acetyltransferase